MSENEKIAEEPAVELSETEEKDVQDHVAQRSPVIFEIIRRSGEEELNRPWLSLWWSGIAAGLSIGFSVLTQALLHAALPSGKAYLLIEKTGYTVGFLMIIMAHQQLFTENTLTAVVPLMAHFHRGNLYRIGRLWSTVLVANIVGTFLFAWFLLHGGLVSEEIKSILHDISLRSFDPASSLLFTRGMVAGFLIASLVWILANIEDGKLATIMIITYLISLGNFTHVIAGSVEIGYLALEGAISWGQAFSHFFIPALFGNIVGGTVLFAMLAYAQIHLELKDAGKDKKN